jgi:hypothetical protein
MLLFLAFNTNEIFAQEQKFSFDDRSKYQKSMERFNSLADFHNEILVFKLLQFTAPFGGAYFETFLNNDGTSHSARITTRARQATRRSTLSKPQVKEINQKLSAFISKGYSRDLQPQDGKLYSAFVFFDGKDYLRFNFVGEIPNELQEVIDFLNIEYEKSEKLRLEAYIDETKLLKEKYGDWIEKPGIIRPTSSGSGDFFNSNRNSTISVNGVQHLGKCKYMEEMPLYYALVFHPEARVISVSSGKGNRSDDPIWTKGIGWVLNGGYKIERKFFITHDAINGTITTEGKTYKLTEGNFLVIRMNKHWKPKITQLKVHLEKEPDIRSILERFKKELADEMLELP